MDSDELSPSDRQERLVDRLRYLVQNWRNYQGTEQSGAQPFLQKILDIYDVAFAAGTVFEQHPVRLPAPVKPSKRAQSTLFGEEDEAPRVRYTTERMDMYLPKICVWEMKSPTEKDLQVHHAQLLGYWARMRPRYMVLCNFREFWIYDTNDEHGQLVPKLKVMLADLPAHPEALSFLRGDVPDLEARTERVTADVARTMGRLVRDLLETSSNADRDREPIARVVLECVFAMFAEDTELVPAGMFAETLRQAQQAGDMKPVWSLFDDFARDGGSKKHNRLAPYVNGPLFDRDQPRVAFNPRQIEILLSAARDFDWQDVRPEIFGTIFEQALSPVERHELGAHYTREADVARVIGPTVIEPWRERINNLRWPKEAEALIAELRAFHVLDPACGCGDFLYVVYREMKRLEAFLHQKWFALQRKVAKRRADIQPPPEGPWFGLHQLHGFEINEFAAFLARVVLWIGEHLAARELGLDESNLPLKNLDETIKTGDALLADWPRPEGQLAIVGNPPYLGVRKLRRELGDEYVEKLFERFPENRAADYVTYWFTKAVEVLRPGERAGFVATNSIAQNESREASLDRVVAKGGTIVDAWKSYPWPGEAAVHIGIVNWIVGPWEGIRRLEGVEVPSIAPDLTSAVDVTTARHLEKNEGLCFMGVTPGNVEFVLTEEQRAEILQVDPKSEAVIKPFLIGRDVNREVDQKPTRWIIDFGVMEKEEAESYAGAMRHVRKHVYPIRRHNRRESRAKSWWKFAEPAPNLRAAIADLKRVVVIPIVSPRLQICRQPANLCFDHQLMVVALSKPFHFGVMQSKFHAAWARARGSTHETRLRYTNTTIFETFPFPLQRDGRYDPREVPTSLAATQVGVAADAFEKARLEACREHGLGLTQIHNLLEAGELKALAKASDALNDAVARAYEVPKDVWRDETELLGRLLELNHRLTRPE